MAKEICCGGPVYGTGRINSLIVKLAAPCNLNCSYCYVYNHEDQSWRRRPKFMTEDVFRRILMRAREYSEPRHGHKMTLIFHGGEPTLIGAEAFDALCRLAKEQLGDRLGHLAMQTNATLLDEKWVEVLVRHKVCVGVSLDGPPEIHDMHRVDHQGRGSHADTLRGARLLQEGGIEPGILCVVNPAHSGERLYQYFRSLGLRSINFLFPHVSHDRKEALFGAYGATPVADYLIPVFDAWLEEDNPEVKIPVFWGLIRRMMGGPGWKDDFGNPLMSYLVVETEGDIEALDALKVCQEGITRSGLNVEQHGFGDLEKGLPLVHQAVNVGIPLPTACEGCPEREVCGGGYIADRFSRANGFNNRSVWCADILKLCAHVRERADLSMAGPLEPNEVAGVLDA